MKKGLSVLGIVLGIGLVLGSFVFAYYIYATFVIIFALTGGATGLGATIWLTVGFYLLLFLACLILGIVLIKAGVKGLKPIEIPQRNYQKKYQRRYK